MHDLWGARSVSEGAQTGSKNRGNRVVPTVVKQPLDDNAEVAPLHRIEIDVGGRLGRHIYRHCFGPPQIVIPVPLLCRPSPEGLSAAAKRADILFVEGITRKNVKFATWGGDTEEEKVRVIGAYHMFPERLKKVYDESGVKSIVMVHVQNYNNPENFDRLGVLNEMIDEGIENILLAQDGDLY